jgi:tetratricopeptide (TPR) repeat protein
VYDAQAIALLVTQPESGARDAREIPLQQSLGTSLIAARGFGNADVEVTFERARVLCEAVGDARRLGFALNGLAEFFIDRGQLERACVLGARMLAVAEQSGDKQLMLMGHYQVGDGEYFQGKFASSLDHFEAARALYPPVRMPAAVIQGPAALGLAAWSLWALGRPDRALAHSREAVVLARQVGHPLRRRA